MPSEVRYQYDFRPVGQGLFCSGRLSRYIPPAVGSGATSPGRQHFNWVYDCGCEGRGDLAGVRARQYRKESGNEVIDLLVLSHFDRDHRNALPDLLQGRKKGWLVLPYRRPFERLLLSFESGPLDSDWIRYLRNPPQYLSSLTGIPRERIIQTLPDSPSGNDNWQGLPSRDPNKKDWIFDVRPQAEALPTQMRIEDTAVTGEGIFISSGAPLPVMSGGQWEFTFYNPPELAQDDLSFLWEVTNEVLANPSIDPLDIFKKLDSAYGNALWNVASRARRSLGGSRQEARNNVSLVAYSGPVHPVAGTQSVRTRQPEQPKVCRFRGTHAGASDPLISPASEDQRSTLPVGVLYTGDIDFGRKLKDLHLPLPAIGLRDRLLQLLTDERRRGISTMLVPHHGSKKNWVLGKEPIPTHHHIACAGWDVAAPPSSTTSAAPLDPKKRKPPEKHPHKEVRDDIARFGRLERVDRDAGILISGSVAWP